MDKNFSIKRVERKIGNTVYVITTRFNGDKKHSLGASIARIICRDASSGGDIPKISA